MKSVARMPLGSWGLFGPPLAFALVKCSAICCIAMRRDADVGCGS
jgi:hypothetical protein